MAFREVVLVFRTIFLDRDSEIIYSVYVTRTSAELWTSATAGRKMS